MNDHLQRFISARCVRVSGGVYELKQFCADFRDSLPADDRANWRRGRIVAALALGGFPVGLRHGIHVVGGLSPRGQFKEIDGRLELVIA